MSCDHSVIYANFKIYISRLTCRALDKWREKNIRADNTSVIVVFFDEYEKAVPPYLFYSTPSDTETEPDEAISS